MIGRIYQIYCLHSDDTYIGSTKNRLCTRFAIHKNEMKLNPKRKIYQKMQELGKHNFKIRLLEQIDYHDKRELKSLEENYRQQLGANLNTYSCNRVKKPRNPRVKKI